MITSVIRTVVENMVGKRVWVNHGNGGIQGILERAPERKSWEYQIKITIDIAHRSWVYFDLCNLERIHKINDTVYIDLSTEKREYCRFMDGYYEDEDYENYRI